MTVNKAEFVFSEIMKHVHYITLLKGVTYLFIVLLIYFFNYAILSKSIGIYKILKLGMINRNKKTCFLGKCKNILILIQESEYLFQIIFLREISSYNLFPKFNIFNKYKP